MNVARITLCARTGSFFPPGNNGDGCVSLGVPPPAAIQGLISAAVGQDVSGVIAGWCMVCSGLYSDYEKIVPARRKPAEDHFESFGNGYRLIRTPVKRSILIEPKLTLYVPEYLMEAFRHPYYTLSLGRSQDIAWVENIAITHVQPLEDTEEAEVEGIICPFPLPSGSIAGTIWLLHTHACGFGDRIWSDPFPFAILEKRQRIRGMANLHIDMETGCTVPFYEV